VPALLILVYGQPLARVARMRTNQITTNDNTTTIQLGRDRIVLPDPIDQLVRDFAAQPRRRTLHDTPGSPWLFPGQKAGAPIAPEGLRRRLNKQFPNMPIRPGRNSAVLNLLRDVPPPILADLLGFSQHPRTDGQPSPPPATANTPLTASPPAETAPTHRTDIDRDRAARGNRHAAHAAIAAKPLALRARAFATTAASSPEPSPGLAVSDAHGQQPIRHARICNGCRFAPLAVVGVRTWTPGVIAEVGLRAGCIQIGAAHDRSRLGYPRGDMSYIAHLHTALDDRLAELTGEIARLEAALAVLATPTPAPSTAPITRSRPKSRRRRASKPTIPTPAPAIEQTTPVAEEPAPEPSPAPPAPEVEKQPAPAPGRRGAAASGRRRPRTANRTLNAQTLEQLLAQENDGASAGALATRAGASYTLTLKLLRELEAAGTVRRTGERRSTSWRLITDDDRIAERAAELEARTAATS
jgi:hypothetical protein